MSQSRAETCWGSSGVSPHLRPNLAMGRGISPKDAVFDIFLPLITQSEFNSRVILLCRIYREDDSDLPPFPDSFQVAKYSIFEEVKLRCVVTAAVTVALQFFELKGKKKYPNLQSSSGSWWVLELQSLREEGGWRYRVVRYRQHDVGSKVWFFSYYCSLPSSSSQNLHRKPF